MRILVVEDDPKISAFISKGLREAGFIVDVAERGGDGLHRGLKSSYDAAIVLNPNGVASTGTLHRWNPVGVADDQSLSQGSSFLATLGSAFERRWRSRFAPLCALL
jgi:two-component system OmpR family response regulator/two-component system copper resistance phosphate regulon response regulator CusR